MRWSLDLLSGKQGVILRLPGGKQGVILQLPGDKYLDILQLPGGNEHLGSSRNLATQRHSIIAVFSRFMVVLERPPTKKTNRSYVLLHNRPKGKLFFFFSQTRFHCVILRHVQAISLFYLFLNKKCIKNIKKKPAVFIGEASHIQVRK